MNAAAYLVVSGLLVSEVDMDQLQALLNVVAEKTANYGVAKDELRQSLQVLHAKITEILDGLNG